MFETFLGPGKNWLPRVVALAATLTLVTVGWFSSTNLLAYRYITGPLPGLLRMQDLQGQILVLDEALGMSARLSAATGDPAWEARYRRLAPQLDQALKESLSLGLKPAHLQAIAQADAASRELAAIENRAFKLVREGQQTQAQVVLSSEAHAAQKQVFAAGIAEIARLLKQDVDSVREQRRVRLLRSLVLAAILTPLLMLGWWLVLRAARRWQTALAESNWQLSKQKAELEDFTHHLDRKVSERTNQLRDSEASLLNMMDDAVMAKSKVESINETLRQEITQRLQAEQALQEANAGLEHKVTERTVELRTAKERAEASDRHKSQFLANMSHELRTPLNAILGFTGTLLMKLPGALNAAQEEQLTIVQTSGRHLLSLINDLLDLAKIDSGKTDLALESISCREIVEDTVAALRPLADGKQLTLRTQLPQNELRVTADQRAFRQILLNLCNNAIKFTDSGSVTVAVAETRGEFGRAVEIGVTDTGIGIRPEDQHKLFQVFSQTDSTQREGTGLGLHLSQKLAQLMHGNIQFKSDYGHGSRFWLTLPVE